METIFENQDWKYLQVILNNLVSYEERRIMTKAKEEAE